MKVTATLFLTLVVVLVGHAQGEYRVKVHPPIPPPPLPPFKYSPSLLKGGGYRGPSNSLGPPRLHHHHLHRHPPGLVHHHIPHGPSISVHHLGGPSPPKGILRPIHAPHHHHHHVPLAQEPFSHPHPPPPHGSSLVHHHHHHHHVPQTGALRPSFKAPWKGPHGGGASFGPGKDTFHPSPPDGAQAIVATHQTVDDNKGPIHTIPAPNLGPSGKHPHSRPVITLGSFGGVGQGSGFQTGHGIGQGNSDAGGPYPNPVYGKPVTADLTYHEPMATPEAQSQLNAKIPTIKIQSSHGYEVHEHGIENLVTPAPIFAHVTTLGPNGAYFAPDPDPSLPAPKIPLTLDPYSHPSNGNSPPDLDQEIPQHLLALYGFNQHSQNVHLQPQVHIQEQHQIHPQLSNVVIPGEAVHQGGYDTADLGGQLILSQALAQFEAQSQPQTYSQVAIHQQHTPHQEVQVIHNSGTEHHAQLAPEYVQAFKQVPGPTTVSVQQVPLVSSSHETLYHTVKAPQVGGVSDGQGGHFSAYDLFANSPVNSPVLDAIKENFHPQIPTSTPAPPTLSVGNNHFQYQLPISTTIAPTSTPVSNPIYGHQQQQFISTTAAPPVLPVVNNIEYQPQIHDFSQGVISNGQSFSDLYHNLGTVALEGHQAQSVSVTNPGQAGYIPATSHSQQSGNLAVPQVQTHVLNFGHDSFSAETRHKNSLVRASEVNALANSINAGIASGSLRKGVETVKPSSSSSFYSEKAANVGNQDTKNEDTSNQQQEVEEDEEYYDEEVSQEVDSDYEKKIENPQPALPSSYSVYESYEDNGKNTEEEKNEQEYDDKDSQYEDYPTQTKNTQKDEIQTNLDEEKTLTRKPPIRNYNHNVEFGTRLRPKKTN